MTAEEIKSRYSMQDVLTMYGLRANRAGFISCPFHQGDRSPSLKIYPKDFHCHACGANGDIFTFVQKMDNCSFKEAFLKLGGNYEKKSDWQRKKWQYELEQKKKKAERKLQRKRQLRMDTIADIKIQKLFVECFPVFSDDWCDAVNALEHDFIIMEELNREGVRLFD